MGCLPCGIIMLREGTEPMDTAEFPFDPDRWQLGGGIRVEVPPHSDHWMRGDRYGALVNTRWVGQTEYGYVRLDKSGKTVRFLASDLTLV